MMLFCTPETKNKKRKVFAVYRWKHFKTFPYLWHPLVEAPRLGWMVISAGRLVKGGAPARRGRAGEAGKDAAGRGEAEGPPPAASLQGDGRTLPLRPQGQGGEGGPGEGQPGGRKEAHGDEAASRKGRPRSQESARGNLQGRRWEEQITELGVPQPPS